MALTTVTVWHLEQGSPSALPAEPVPAPAGVDLAVVRAELIGPEFARFLYTAVGGVWHWTDRLAWSHADWEKWLSVPGTETWVAWVSGTPAGYVQLAPRGEGVVEVVYFGLLPAFIGRGLGGHLLDLGLRRAWDLAERHPSLPATRRVIVETCSLDGPAALRNYRSRGFELARTETVHKPVGEAPGPWPGSGYGHRAPSTV
ncbi:GNAT family N-acetyltransferase [Streptacidiphilus neutrinimicus]|uniref:GNAT family N-acetyltransferase n=1 Tax=Streptacidiphilus neutrinimicus TaxID=105420 RepID=UPI0005A87DB4|nr:GNAT family N-acetyltransferase [Streptacidiphilus neutrinimicus]